MCALNSSPCALTRAYPHRIILCSHAEGTRMRGIRRPGVKS